MMASPDFYPYKAILTTLSSGFGPMPAMLTRQIGYGAGVSDPEIPNLLRLFVGDRLEKTTARYQSPYGSTGKVTL